MFDPNLLNSKQFSVIGNIVTAGLQLYIRRFKPYLRIAITAHLWLLIPLVGWAKFCALSSHLAQLAFHDLTQSTESIAVPQKQVSKRGWSVLITNLLAILLVSLIAVLALVAAAFLVGLISMMISVIFSVAPLKLDAAKPFDTPFSLAVSLGGNLFWIAAALWAYTRYFIVELPLTLECNYKPITAIKRCQDLSRGSFFFILGVIVVVFVLTCPISYVAVNIFGFRLMRLVLRSLQLDFSTRQLIGYSSFVILSLLLNAVTMPFWQATKATLYYTLRSCREGFDLSV